MAQSPYPPISVLPSSQGEEGLKQKGKNGIVLQNTILVENQKCAQESFCIIS